jgi:hypothetical protein
MYPTAANLDGMHVKTPIRADNAPGKARPPLSGISLGQTKDFVAHAWSNGSQLNESSPRDVNGRGTDREERLLRLVDILRTEQISADTVADTEVGKISLHRWRGPCFWAIVVILMGAAALLLASRPNLVSADVRPDLPHEPGYPIQLGLTAKIAQPLRDGTGDTHVSTDKPINPSFITPFPEGLPQGDPLQSPPIIEHQVADRPSLAKAATSLDGNIAATKPDDVIVPKHEADSPANPTSAALIGDVSGSKTNKPALMVYFPRGSLRAETNAENLAVRVDANLAKADFEAQSTLPDDAVIKYSGEGGHKLARVVGKSLGDFGYRWRIVNSSSPVGAHGSMIEVWLPR